MAGSERTAVHSSGAEMLRNDTIDEKAICDEGQGAVAILPDLNHIDKSEVLRKMDIRLIPMLALLYLLSFLDRGNIGNAEIEGLSRDLGLRPSQYNWCLTVFFFTYSVFELPSNLCLKRFRPSRWLPAIMVAWGLVMTLMGLVQNYHGLLIARIFLGVAEAGLFPGVTYYLTMWYCRHEIQLRQSLFFSAASIAGAFSGLLAFAISKMDGVAGLEGWRWIFILEGIATVLVAFSAFFVIHDFPETASFLTPDEKAFVMHRLKYQGQEGLPGHPDAQGIVHVEQAEEFEWKYIGQAFADWQIWVSIIICWGIVCPLYGISLFLPTIIKSLDYSNAEAQLMTVPIYVAASIIAIIVAFLSDRVGKRSPFIIGFMFVMLIGFTMCIASSNPRVVYGGVFISACAIYPAFPGLVTWLSNNLSGSYKRSAGMALQIGVGNLGGAMASNFYRKPDGPRYFLGHGLELGFIVAGIFAAVVLVFVYKRRNSERSRQMSEEGRIAYTAAELSAMGDKAVTFRYMF